MFPQAHFQPESETICAETKSFDSFENMLLQNLLVRLRALLMKHLGVMEIRLFLDNFLTRHDLMPFSQILNKY